MEKVKSTVLEYKHNPKLILLEKRYIAEGLPQEGQTDLVLINLNGDKILSFSCATVNNKWTAKNNCSYLEFVCFEDFFAVCKTKRGKENDKDVLIYDYYGQMLSKTTYQNLISKEMENKKPISQQDFNK